jgi:tetratricopeptide (TPR) repeat protein
MTRKPNDVLEQNVSTLLESGGERPQIADTARARILAELVARHGTPARDVVVPARKATRTPLVAVGFGLAATAAAVLIVSRFVGGGEMPIARHADAEGATYLTEPGAKVTVLGPRHLRVEGAALIDVVPGNGVFTVETAHGRIEVLGTKFLVDGEATKTTAAVVRGEVKLASDHGEVLLHAGEQGVSEPGRPPVRGPAPRLSHLVSWAQQARHRDEKTVTPLHHGTLFARDPGVRSHPPWGEEYPLPIAKLSLDVVVEDQVARVALDQTFRNTQNQALEGVYRFAIPPDAALQRLAMYVDGKLMESAVVERMQARRIYEELVYRRVDPALLEWAGTGRLSLRVYPIPALQDKRLMLAYTQSLPKLYSDWTLAIPLPEVDQPVGDMDVAVRVKGCANCELTSTSHPVEVAREGDDAIVRYHRGGEKIGDSFVLHVRDPRHETQVATSEVGSDRYMLVRAPADLVRGPRKYQPRTWVLLDDVSASRSSLELRAQADLVEAFLGELDENDRVAVVAFDVEAREKLRATRVLDVDHKAVRKALAEEGGVGATDFGVALDAAAKALEGVNPDDAMIVYLGDGVITDGDRTLDKLRERIAGKAHFVGVGIGDGPDTQTLQGLASSTGGYATTIDLADDLAWRAFDLVAALHTARVTGIEATLVDDHGALVPSTTYLSSPQLADGEELELVTKLAGSGKPAAVQLHGMLDGMPWGRTVELAAKPHANASYLPRLWAQHHIAARLLAKHEPVAVLPCISSTTNKHAQPAVCQTEAEARDARDEVIRQEVVGLGKQYFLLSRHTSLLVLENDAMYAQYNVKKGAGDTWAPYAMPRTIPVVVSAASPLVDVADDAELVRTPIQVFYQPAAAYSAWEGERGAFKALDAAQFARKGIAGNDNAPIVITAAPAPVMVSIPETKPTSTTRNGLGLATQAQSDFQAHLRRTDDRETADLVIGNVAGGESDRGYKHQRFVTGTSGDWLALDANEEGGGVGMGTKTGESWPVGSFSAARLTHPSDVAFDDLTGFVPALLPDPADGWRRELERDGETKHTIDEAARKLLVDARRKLPAGIYRWGTVELAVDDARHIGWRRTTDAGLTETASFDGTTWTRRYAELGLDATRAVHEDDIAIALGYLPVWIAEPAHYAKWFDVKARGARAVELSRQIRGETKIAFVLQFDDQDRLIAISDGKTKLLEITWGQGPVAARVLGERVSVGFTGQSIDDAAQWAHRGAQPGIAVELPARVPAYWETRLAKETAGTPTWRHAQRQWMVSLAATQNRDALWRAYEDLRKHGGVELGELALASGGITATADDSQLAKALAPLAREPLAWYLSAGRTYARAPIAARVSPKTHEGLIGALWSLRSVVAQLEDGKGKAATDELIAMGDRAFMLRAVGASALGTRYDLDPKDVVRAWDSVAVGDYRNLARGLAAQALFNRGMYDACAELVVRIIDELDLDAMAPQLGNALYTFNQSRRGAAGWNIVWAKWRTKVLAGSSYPHVMGLLSATQVPQEVQTILARAAELAGDDTSRKLAVARSAISRGQGAWAEAMVRPLLKASPSHDMYQLVANLELQQGKTAEALTDLEAAQEAGGDDAVDINVVRSELSQIIALAHQLAVQTTGTERAQVVTRALRWGSRWRAIDPGNSQIDQQLGELLLAVGDLAGAKRQLSSTIEHDPWSGAGYTVVAEAFERQGKVEEALPLWEQAIRIDQTNPTPRLRKAQALIALGRSSEGDVILAEIGKRKWHDVWSSVVYQANDLLARGKQTQK